MMMSSIALPRLWWMWRRPAGQLSITLILASRCTIRLNTTLPRHRAMHSTLLRPVHAIFTSRFTGDISSIGSHDFKKSKGSEKEVLATLLVVSPRLRSIRDDNEANRFAFAHFKRNIACPSFLAYASRSIFEIKTSTTTASNGVPQLCARRIDLGIDVR